MADTMFEELGYNLIEKRNDRLLYEKELYENGYLQYELYIIFELKEQEFYKTNCSFKDVEYITMQELQAINEKCKELGWLDNDEQHIPRID